MSKHTLRSVPPQGRLRYLGTQSLLLFSAFTSSAVIAGTGIIPTDEDTYPANVTPIPAVLSQCFACHGPNGRSEYADWPSLAGQKESYLLQELQAFKSGARIDPMMQPVVAVLTEADMKVAAEYLSKQPPPIPSGNAEEVARPATAAVCMACHDNAALPNEPFLNAQQADYLAAQLVAYRDGTRKDPIMEGMAKNLSDEDILALANYFSAQPPVQSAQD